jgi:hypothetical protein
MFVGKTWKVYEVNVNGTAYSDSVCTNITYRFSQTGRCVMEVPGNWSENIPWVDRNFSSFCYVLAIMNFDQGIIMAKRRNCNLKSLFHGRKEEDNMLLYGKSIQAN